jgi:hypothetical protein
MSWFKNLFKKKQKPSAVVNLPRDEKGRWIFDTPDISNVKTKEIKVKNCGCKSGSVCPCEKKTSTPKTQIKPVAKTTQKKTTTAKPVAKKSSTPKKK